MDKHFGDGFDQLADTAHITSLILENSSTGERLKIDNVPGKQASVKILYNIVSENKFKLTANEALQGLALYGDYTLEERNNSGSHPNIKLLIETISYNHEWVITAS
ncbi:MAG: DUF2322 family protein [Pseudomonadota bacterium]